MTYEFIRRNPRKTFSARDLRQEAEKRLRRKKASRGRDAPPEIIRLMHELQVHQIELEMQNEALLRTIEEKEELSEKYSDLFDFAPMGYFLWDRHGKILEINLPPRPYSMWPGRRPLKRDSEFSWLLETARHLPRFSSAYLPAKTNKLANSGWQTRAKRSTC